MTTLSRGRKLNTAPESDNLFTDKTPQYDFAVLYGGGIDSGGALASGIMDLVTDGKKNPRALCIVFDLGNANKIGEQNGGKRLARALELAFPGVRIDVEVFELPIYRPFFNRFHLQKPFNLYGDDADVGAAVFPMRNFIIAPVALAACQMLHIPELHVGIGYGYSGVDMPIVWDSNIFAAKTLMDIANLQIISVASSQNTRMADDSRLGSVRLVSPMYGQTKPKWAQSVEKRLKRMTRGKVSLTLTHSCRESNTATHCGECGACMERYAAFPDWKERETKKPKRRLLKRVLK